MIYRRRIFTIFVFFLAVIMVFRAKSQTYFTSMEFGIAMGGSQYFGDLNDNYGFQTISAAGGIYARKHMNTYISLKLVANYTQVSYDDKYNTSLYQHLRNLNFTSQVYECALQAEFNFFSFVTGDPYHRFTPFLTGGIGAFYYDPYTTYNGVQTYLRPLGTEGQYAGYSNRKYGNVSPCFPIGAGAKFWVKGGVNLTLEIADRLTTTDYLDDVSTTYVGAGKFPSGSAARGLQDRSLEIKSQKSPIGTLGKQRGNTSSYDQYIVALLSISWHFTTYHCPEFMRSYENIKTTR